MSETKWPAVACPEWAKDADQLVRLLKMFPCPHAALETDDPNNPSFSLRWPFHGYGSIVFIGAYHVTSGEPDDDPTHSSFTIGRDLYSGPSATLCFTNCHAACVVALGLLKEATSTTALDRK